MKKILPLVLIAIFFIAAVDLNAKNQAVQNQNQVQTQNQGEESQLQVNTQEQEEANFNNASVVAEKVQDLLEVKTKGGIGDQVRQIAQEQNQVQAEIKQQVGKLEGQGKLNRFFFGADLKTLNGLKMQLEQNQLKITALEELKTEISNQGDEVAIEATVLALNEQNTALQAFIASEERVKGMFGWLLRLF